MTDDETASQMAFTDKAALSPERPKRRRRPKRYRETPDVAAGVLRLVAAIGNRVAEGDPEDIEELVKISRAVDAAMRRGVAGLRAVGHSDGEIGEILGVTKQAVNQRFPRTP